MTKGGVRRVATPKPKPQIFCPKKQARIFPFRLGSENGAGDKTLRTQPKKGSIFGTGGLNLSPAEEGHFGRHHGDEGHVGFQR